MASGGKFQYDHDGRVVVYTDGCCLNNGVKGEPKRGGIGVYFGPNNKLNYSGPVKGKPTNNIAEIQAATKAVELCKSAGFKKILIKTDSENVSKAMNEWIEDWVKNDWWTIDYDTNEPKRVANEMEYKQLLEVSKGLDVKYEHIEGHAKKDLTGVSSPDKVGNDAADDLANEGAKKAPVYMD